MICVGHRLQCELANLTNHKFPVTGQWVFEVKCNQLYMSQSVCAALRVKGHRVAISAMVYNFSKPNGPYSQLF